MDDSYCSLYFDLSTTKKELKRWKKLCKAMGNESLLSQVKALKSELKSIDRDLPMNQRCL